MNESCRARSDLRWSALRVMTEFSSLDLLHDPVLVLSVDGRIQVANGAACEFYAWPAAPVGKHLSEVLRIPELDIAAWDAKAITASGSNLRCVHVPWDGTPRHVEWTCHRRSFAGADVIVSVSRPSDGRFEGPARSEHELEVSERVQQSQRMEAIGRLAGGVAHDFNNLLTGILGFVELSLLELSDRQQELAANLQEIRQAAQQAADLTKRLLIFSRTHLIEPRVIDLCDACVQAEKFLVRVIGEDIELGVRADAAGALVRIDPAQLNHLLVNLVTNARDAMPKGGRLSIDVTNLSAGPDFCRLHPGMTPGPYVQLAVSDTGVGLSKEQSARAFEPFSSTKQRQRGTGLGLSTVYGIARQNGGIATLYSEPGVGTSVKVYFPKAAAEERAEPRASRPPLRKAGGRATVLLAEDEQIVRRVARQILERAGYAVFEAPDASTALLLHEQISPVDLLLSDVVMPDMNGRELFEKLCQRQPDLPCVLMSGYTNDEMLQRGVRASGLEFVGKPFTSNALLDKVTKAVGER